METRPYHGKSACQPTKLMILVFFDSKGLIYTHIMPRGALINAKFILVVLGKLLVHLRKKRPEMVKRDWFFP
jgi:hypothetical protein